MTLANLSNRLWLVAVADHGGYNVTFARRDETKAHHIAMAMLDEFSPALQVSLDEPSSLGHSSVCQFQAPHDSVMMALRNAGWRPPDAPINA